jgi:hypothetical protein
VHEGWSGHRDGGEHRDAELDHHAMGDRDRPDVVHEAQSECETDGDQDAGTAAEDRSDRGGQRDCDAAEVRHGFVVRLQRTRAIDDTGGERDP